MLSLLMSVMMSPAFAAETATIKVDGSSTVFPITEAMAEEFQSSKKGAVRVTVGVSGTGGGFKKFCRGETDVQDASRPITAGEMETCKTAGVKYMELPIAYDAIVVAVNPKNDWLNEATIEDLKKMWEPGAQGKITKWSQVNPKWPDQPIKLFGAGSDSGTFDYFTEAIVGKSKSSRGDYTASEDDNTLVTGIANDKYALGYLPLSYAEANKAKLKAVAIVGKDGKAVKAERKTVEAGSYYLGRPIFIYLSEKSMQRPEVREFAEFYLKSAEKIVPDVKYVPLPAKAYTLGLEHLKKNKLGTMFGGKELIGVKIEELMKREASM